MPDDANFEQEVEYTGPLQRLSSDLPLARLQNHGGRSLPASMSGKKTTRSQVPQQDQSARLLWSDADRGFLQFTAETQIVNKARLDRLCRAFTAIDCSSRDPENGAGWKKWAAFNTKSWPKLDEKTGLMRPSNRMQDECLFVGTFGYDELGQLRQIEPDDIRPISMLPPNGSLGVRRSGRGELRQWNGRLVYKMNAGPVVVPDQTYQFVH